jgi:hypothetical protein
MLLLIAGALTDCRIFLTERPWHSRRFRIGVVVMVVINAMTILTGRNPERFNSPPPSLRR